MLKISERIDPDRTILTLQGRLDFSARTTFQSAIRQVRASNTSQIILDMAGVSFIDSSGFGWLMVTHHELQNAQQHLILIVPSGPLLSVIKLVELDRLMTIVPTEEDVPVPTAATHS